MSPVRAALSAVTLRDQGCSVLVGLAAAVALACGGPRVAQKSSKIPRITEPVDYLVRVGPDLDLTVESTSRVAAPGLVPLVVDGPAMPYVEDVTLAGDAKSIAPRREGFDVACAAPCRIAYRFRLREAARRLADVDTAVVLGDAIVAPPSTWLLRPRGAREGRYRFRVETPPGVGFATGLRATGEAGARVYEGDFSDVDESAFAVFGAVKVRLLSPAGIDAAIVSGLKIADEEVAAWLTTELSAISAYFGHAPGDRLTIIVAPGTSEVTRGKTLGASGASVLIRVGTRITPASLRDDWVVAHELVHVAFPSLAYAHNWFSEGLATYVEPVARARQGAVSPEKFWADLVEGLPQGLPREGDRGLEGTEDWGRVYWGGALYFLIADLAIREQTGGTRSLDDAIRAVARPGTNVETALPIEQVLEEGDRSTGTRVLHDLFTKMAVAPGATDLEALWKRLGIRQLGRSQVSFDDTAPAARFRKAITAAGTTEQKDRGE
jgi:predicted metalloprotease with PDZ domain